MLTAQDYLNTGLVLIIVLLVVMCLYAVFNIMLEKNFTTICLKLGGGDSKSKAKEIVDTIKQWFKLISKKFVCAKRVGRTWREDKFNNIEPESLERKWVFGVDAGYSADQKQDFIDFNSNVNKLLSALLGINIVPDTVEHKELRNIAGILCANNLIAITGPTIQLVTKLTNGARANELMQVYTKLMTGLATSMTKIRDPAYIVGLLNIIKPIVRVIIMMSADNVPEDIRWKFGRAVYKNEKAVEFVNAIEPLKVLVDIKINAPDTAGIIAGLLDTLIKYADAQ